MATYITLHPNQQKFKLYKQTKIYILNYFRVHPVSNIGSHNTQCALILPLT